MLNNDYTKPYEKFKELLKKEFEINWDFADIENWINKSKFDKNKKTFIEDLILLFKSKVQS